MRRAVFYVASDDDNGRYIQEAQHSCGSVKERLPGIKTILFLSGGGNPAPFDEVRRLPAQRGPFWYLDSTRFIVQAVEELQDFDELLYLDTDTYIAWSCPEIFDLLQSYEFAAGHSPQRDCCVSTTSIVAPSSFCSLENGVNAFRNNEKVRQFLREEWLGRYEANWQQYGNNDNGPLRDALWENNLDLRWSTLAPEWSLRFDFGCWVQGRVRILHGRVGGISTNVIPLDGVARQINTVYRMRIWRHGRLLEPNE